MKYLGLLASALLLAVLLASWQLARTQGPMPRANSDHAALQAQLREADAEIRKTAAVQAQLDALALAVFSGTENDTALAFVRPRPEVDPDAPVAPRFPERTVSMVYIAHGFERAVIDGVYAAEGDRLPGGGRVKTIAPDRIVILEREGTRAIELEPGMVRRTRGPSP